jgi:peptide/nickel transport system permease protein
VRRDLGLDDALHVQYLTFLGNAFQGDLGTSFVFRESALQVILERFPATFELALSAMVIAVFVGVPLGLVAGAFADTALDRSLMVGSVLGFSLPTFWVGILLILLFAVTLGWLPASGRGDTVEVLGIEWSFLTLDGLRHLALPAFNLALFPMALLVRLTRAGMREAMDLDFARFARAQGNTRFQVIVHYVLKYVSIPLVTLAGLYFGILIAFAVVTETVFSWPGMGKLLIDSINLLDRPVIVAYLLVTVVVFVTLSLIVDLVYALLDPRVRLE